MPMVIDINAWSSWLKLTHWSHLKSNQVPLTMSSKSVLKSMYQRKVWIWAMVSYEKLLSFTTPNPTWFWLCKSGPKTNVSMCGFERWVPRRVACRQAGLSETEWYTRHIPKTRDQQPNKQRSTTKPNSNQRLTTKQLQINNQTRVKHAASTKDYRLR